ncbi:OmpA family protein [Candidatus Albibeggiatoa sp. nov. NOAA]|uniref:OmpA family protein n=1 Tax=Candidatus Albibeggiatoa sp. nov. NOAA TaxID=3162724 RepID=UPI0032FAF980|nr:OmpA family protein [Thiotrichaceae bacterium]
MKYSHIMVLCCLAMLQACSFPKVASKNAIITTGSVCCNDEPPVIAPRLLSNPVPIRSFSIQSAAAPISPIISETILFPTDKYYLSRLAVSLISDFANQVRNDNRSILIEGYTDSRDTSKYNKRLSQNRATAVRDGLIAQGIAPQRLVINAFGEGSPVASNKTAVGRQQNRRVEIKTMPAQTAPATVINSQFTSPRFQPF